MKSSSNPSTKIAEQFRTKGVLDQKKQADLFSHATSQVMKETPANASDLEKNKDKFRNVWYMKKIGSAIDAMLEVIAQEFFRLLIEGQPKTRLATSAQQGTYILSKQVETFESLTEVSSGGRMNFKDQILNDMLTGMGGVVVIAMLMNEIDLKSGNMGRDKNQRIVKIDGDNCFARIKDKNYRKNNYDITGLGIQQLPYVSPAEYEAYNWFNANNLEKKQGVERDMLVAAQRDISKHPKFRTEVNEAILRVMMLPDELIKKFILRYIPQGDVSDILYNEIILRRDRLLYAAAQNDSFQQYLKSPEAEVHQAQYIAYLLKFNTTNKNNILGSNQNEKDEAVKEINAHVDKMKIINQKINQDPRNFAVLDSIAYPILKIFDDPVCPERKALIDQLKTAAKAAYASGPMEGYEKAWEYAQDHIVHQIIDVDQFLELDDLASQILSIEDNLGPQFAKRQKFLDELKKAVKEVYAKLASSDPQVKAAFNYQDELDLINNLIKNKCGGTIEYFMEVDVVVLPVLQMIDDSSVAQPIRQALQKLKPVATAFYNGRKFLPALTADFSVFNDLIEFYNQTRKATDEQKLDAIVKHPQRQQAIAVVMKEIESSFSTLDVAIKNLQNAEIHKFDAFDKLACQFIGISDFPDKERQPFVDSFKTVGKKAYEALSNNASVKKSVGILMGKKNALDKFIEVDKIALPILQLPDDADPNSRRQLAINFLKDAARECYKNSSFLPGLEKDFDYFNKLDKLVEKLGKEVDGEKVSNEVAQFPERQKVILEIKEEIDQCFDEPDLEVAYLQLLKTVIEPFDVLEKEIRELVNLSKDDTGQYMGKLPELLRRYAAPAYADIYDPVSSTIPFELRQKLEILTKKVTYIIKHLAVDSADYPNYKNAIKNLLGLSGQVVQEATLEGFRRSFDAFSRACIDFDYFQTLIEKIAKLKQNKLIQREAIDLLMSQADRAYLNPAIDNVNSIQLLDNIMHLEKIADKMAFLTASFPIEPYPARAAVVKMLNDLLNDACHQGNFSIAFSNLSLRIREAIGDLDRFLEFYHLANSILAVENVIQGSPLWMLQQIAAESYLHPESPYYTLIKRLNDCQNDPNFASEVQFYYETIARFSLFREQRRMIVDSMPDGEGKKECEAMFDLMEIRLKDCLLKDNTKADYDFALGFAQFNEFAISILAIPGVGSESRKKAISWMKEMVLAHYGEHFVSNYNDSLFGKRAFDLIDKKLDNIKAEIVIAREAGTTNKDYFYKSSLLNLKTYLNALYAESHESETDFSQCQAKIAAADRVLVMIREIKGFKSESDSIKLAINSLKIFARETCSDPVKFERSLARALNSYHEIYNQAMSNKENTPIANNAFSDAFRAFSGKPATYKVVSDIAGEAMKQQTTISTTTRKGILSKYLDNLLHRSSASPSKASQSNGQQENLKVNEYKKIK